MRDLNEGTKSASEAFIQLGISTGGAVASGALIGSVFGPVGAVIGGVAGAVGSLVTAFITYETEAEQMINSTEEFRKSVKNSAEQWKNSQEIIASSARKTETEISSLEKLKESLKECIDENGRLKQGYQERASFILNDLNEALGTEFKLNDLIIGDYDEIISKIDELIEKRRIASITEYFEKNYKEAMDSLPESIKNANIAQENLNKALESMRADQYSEDIEDLYNEWCQLSDAQREAEGSFQEYAKEIADDAFWHGTGNLIEENSNLLGKATKKNIENLSLQDEAYRNSSKTLKEQQEATDKYNQAMILSQKNRTDELLLLYDKELYTVENATKEIKGAYTDRINGIDGEIKRQQKIIETGTELERQSAKLEIEIQKNKLKNIRELLQKQSETVKQLTPEIVADWKTLAEKSHGEYVEGLKGLDSATQIAIQKATGVIVNETDVAIPRIEENVKEIAGIINELGGDFTLDPSININPQVSLQVSNLKTKLTNLRDSISGLSGGIIGAGVQLALNTAITKLNLLGYAEGGFPDMGEIFLARERGPELVGKIGSRTAVANNSQIVEAVSNGVYTAVSEAMNTNSNSGPVKISGKLNGRELIQFTIDGINGIKQQTGECPIEVL